MDLVWGKDGGCDQRSSSITYSFITWKGILVLALLFFFILPGITLQHEICGTWVDDIILILLNIKRRVLLPMSFRNWSLKTLALARVFLMVIRKCEKLSGPTLKLTFPMTAAPKLKLRSEIIVAYPCNILSIPCS